VSDGLRWHRVTVRPTAPLVKGFCEIAVLADVGVAEGHPLSDVERPETVSELAHVCVCGRQ
jgi:hypothetical protein